MGKSELEPKQTFDFIVYQLNLKKGNVRPTLKCWKTLTIDLTFSSQEGSTAHHIVNGGNLISPTSGDTNIFFWYLAGLANASNITNYPLGEVLTYKNLVYLLNLQIYKFKL